MCNKLLQTYICAHTKTICTTSCPHALDTGHQVLGAKNSVSRSASTVSSIMPSARRDEPPSRRCFQPPSPSMRNSPASLTSPMPTPGYPESSTLPSHSHTASQSAPPQSAPTSPTLATSPSLAHLRPQALTDPNYCPYHFTRPLPQSRQPCIDCYMLPEWEHLSKRWMNWYRQEHPLEKLEDVEHNAGIQALRETQVHIQRSGEGLLNLFVHGDESAGRIG